jgi:serine/threonine-protein kinase
LLFYALTGQKLDMGGSQFLLVQKRQRVPDLGGVDLRIRPLLERMLQPDPEKRPATMEEIANWRYASPSPPAGNPTAHIDARAPWLERAKAAGKSRPRWLTLAAPAVAALVGAGGYAFYSLIWSAPASFKPPPLPAFGQQSQVPQPGPRPASSAAQVPAPAPTPAASGAASRDHVRNYVEQYNGGDCFFVLPVAISPTAAVVEGFGASTAAFDTFGKAVRRDLGFEASIGVRQVTPAQCPAVKFISQLAGNPARAPRISLDSVEVRNGDTLSGTIENAANRVVELLLVSDRGEVRNLSYLLKPGTDSFSFSIGIQRSGNDGGPQLVIAVATPQVLDALRQSKPMAADAFFLEAISEAQRNNVMMSAAARYFRLSS